MHDDRLVSTSEAARLAHVSVGSIQHWMRTGRLAPCGVLPRSEQAKRLRPAAATGKYQRHQFRLADVLAARFDKRMTQLREQHADLNLLTVREMAARCEVQDRWAYQLIKKFDLQRYYIDDWVYMVSGVELWEKAQDDPYYAQLFLKL